LATFAAARKPAHLLQKNPNGRYRHGNRQENRAECDGSRSCV